MKRIILLIVIVILLATAGFYIFNRNQTKAPAVQPSSSDSQSATISGVFEGITPCDNSKRPLPQIPSNASCEMTIWHISFNPDFMYTLTSSYGMSQPNTTGIRGGGTRVNMEGNWNIVKGTRTNPEASVIQLNTADSQTSVSFLKVNDNIIHLLDNDKNMMVGNGGWAYTLSKTSGVAINNTALPSLPEGAPINGVFEGRTLCIDSLAEFTQMPRGGCDRIKWKLTLSPTRYLLQTSRGSMEGDWTAEGNVYKLKSDKNQQALSFLKVDDNHLFFLDKEMNLVVGDSLWSYTLSKTNNSN